MSPPTIFAQAVIQTGNSAIPSRVFISSRLSLREFGPLQKASTLTASRASKPALSSPS